MHTLGCSKTTIEMAGFKGKKEEEEEEEEKGQKKQSQIFEREMGTGKKKGKSTRGGEKKLAGWLQYIAIWGVANLHEIR